MSLHRFENPVADDGANETGPSEWNDEHVQPYTLRGSGAAADWDIPASSGVVFVGPLQIPNGATVRIGDEARLVIL